MSNTYPRCHEIRPCFARDRGACTILTETYPYDCPFCKPEREVTNGKHYPHREGSLVKQIEITHCAYCTYQKNGSCTNKVAACWVSPDDYCSWGEHT